MEYSPPDSSVLGISQARILGNLSPGIFPTQGLNLSLLHFRQILYHWATLGSPQSQTIYVMVTFLLWTTYYGLKVRFCFCSRKWILSVMSCFSVTSNLRLVAGVGWGQSRSCLLFQWETSQSHGTHSKIISNNSFYLYSSSLTETLHINSPFYWLGLRNGDNLCPTPKRHFAH